MDGDALVLLAQHAVKVAIAVVEFVVFYFGSKIVKADEKVS